LGNNHDSRKAKSALRKAVSFLKQAIVYDLGNSNLLKTVKAIIAWRFFSIFVLIMGKHLFGIFIAFVFMLPLASKAPGNLHAHHLPNSTKSSIVSKENPSSPTQLVESFVLEAEDEDELSDAENESSTKEWMIENQFISTSFTFYAPAIHLTSHTSPNRRTIKPLYILWSSFLI